MVGTCFGLFFVHDLDNRNVLKFKLIPGGVYDVYVCTEGNVTPRYLVYPRLLLDLFSSSYPLGNNEA